MPFGGTDRRVEATATAARSQARINHPYLTWRVTALLTPVVRGTRRRERAGVVGPKCSPGEGAGRRRARWRS